MNSRIDHQEEEQTTKMHLFYSHTLLVVPYTGDQLILYKLALVQRCNLANILNKFHDGLTTIAVLRSTEKAARQIYDEAPLEALTAILFSPNELRHSSDFWDILLNFPFLESCRAQLILFFICGRLGDFNNFPSPQKVH